MNHIKQILSMLIAKNITKYMDKMDKKMKENIT